MSKCRYLDIDWELEEAQGRHGRWEWRMHSNLRKLGATRS